MVYLRYFICLCAFVFSAELYAGFDLVSPAGPELVPCELDNNCEVRKNEKSKNKTYACKEGYTWKRQSRTDEIKCLPAYDYNRSEKIIFSKCDVKSNPCELLNIYDRTVKVCNKGYVRELFSVQDKNEKGKNILEIRCVRSGAPLLDGKKSNDRERKKVESPNVQEIINEIDKALRSDK